MSPDDSCAARAIEWPALALADRISALDDMTDEIARKEERDAERARADAAEAEVGRLRAVAAKAAEAAEALEYLVDYSGRMYHDSTRWESEDETAPRWQAWRDWAYDAIKAAKGEGR
jgi:hypothetical protein